MSTLAQLWPLLLATAGVLGGIGGGVWAARLVWVRAFLERLRHERDAVVLEVEQVFVDATLRGRSPSSPGGAELTADEQREALSLAVTRLMELLGLATIERALRILGLPTLPLFVGRWLTTWVEAGVKELSIRQAAANKGGSS